MYRPIWWIGLILFVFGAFGAVVPPEDYPGWYARMWGITHPYRTDGVGKSAGVNAQIWTGHGIKGVGGDTKLDLNQPALRQEASDADARVDGRAQHRTWMTVLAIVGVFLMFSGIRQSDQESDDQRLRRLERTNSAPSETEQRPEGDETSPNPDVVSSAKAFSPPLEPINDDPEPGWWSRLFSGDLFRRRRTPAPAPTPIDINIVVESFGEEEKSKARHVLTAQLPPMTVHSVKARLQIGANTNTVQEMDLDVR